MRSGTTTTCRRSGRGAGRAARWRSSPCLLSAHITCCHDVCRLINCCTSAHRVPVCGGGPGSCWIGDDWTPIRDPPSGSGARRQLRTQVLVAHWHWTLIAARSGLPVRCGAPPGPPHQNDRLRQSSAPGRAQAPCTAACCRACSLAACLVAARRERGSCRRCQSNTRHCTLPAPQRPTPGPGLTARCQPYNAFAPTTQLPLTA